MDPEYRNTNILSLAVAIGEKRELPPQEVLKVFEKYIFYYLNISKTSKNRISEIFDLLLEAEEFAKNN